MKPILLVVAGIAMLILAIYLYNRKAGNKQLRPVPGKEKATGIIKKDSYSVLSNEVRLYEFIY